MNPAARALQYILLVIGMAAVAVGVFVQVTYHPDHHVRQVWTCDPQGASSRCTDTGTLSTHTGDNIGLVTAVAGVGAIMSAVAIGVLGLGGPGGPGGQRGYTAAGPGAGSGAAGPSGGYGGPGAAPGGYTGAPSPSYAPPQQAPAAPPQPPAGPGGYGGPGKPAGY